MRLKPAALCMLFLLLAGCQTNLYSNLSEQDANEMLALLQRNAVPAAKVRQKDGRDTLTVDQSRFSEAVELLHQAGLPRRTFESMGDVFQPTGLVASPLQERARFLWALSQELAHTISDIDGVLTAHVQVVLPNNDLLNRDPTPSSASVFVRYDSTSDVVHLVPQIKQLVANSVEGLSYDKVSVVLVPALPTANPGVVSARLQAHDDTGSLLAGAFAGALLTVCSWVGMQRLLPLLNGMRRWRKVPPELTR